MNIPDPDVEQAPASGSERAASLALVLLAGIAGWLSYASVRALAVAKIGPIEGSAFPLLLDVGVYVASQYYLGGARRGKAQHGYKTLTRALIAATIAINAAAAHDWRSVLVHVVPPAVFAALVELRARQVLGEARESLGTKRIPLRLWLVSPVKAFRISLHVARLSAHGELWEARERRAAAERALKLAVPGRRARQARRQARAVLRTGQLDPAELIAATGLDRATEQTGPDAVLRAALRAALGASASQGANASGSASGMQSPGASEGASGKRIRGASVTGQGALVLPAPRRARSASQMQSRGASAPAFRRTDDGASEAKLKADALDLDRASLAETGSPAGLRQLQRELGIGQASATRLRDWLAAQRAQMDVVTHANGTEN